VEVSNASRFPQAFGVLSLLTEKTFSAVEKTGSKGVGYTFTYQPCCGRDMAPGSHDTPAGLCGHGDPQKATIPAKTPKQELPCNGSILPAFLARQGINYMKETGV
jgi:hypothetical protein